MGDSDKCIERIILPPPGSSGLGFPDPASTFADLSETSGKPHVGLLFIAPGMYGGREVNNKLELQVAARYGHFFDGKLIVVGCDQTTTENIDELRSCEGPRGPATGTPGLLFWQRDGLRVRVSHDDLALHQYSCGEQQDLRPSHIEKLVDELGFEDGEDSTLIFLAKALPPYVSAALHLFNTIEARCRGKRVNLWGGYFYDDFSIAENVGTDYLLKDAAFVVIRLTGPRLNSVMSIIKCINPQLEVDRRLRRLKSWVKRKLHIMMLIAGPEKIDSRCGNCYPDCKEFKGAVKKLFSRDIQILGAFRSVPHAIGVDLTSRDSVEGYFCQNSMYVMILSYD